MKVTAVGMEVEAFHTAQRKIRVDLKVTRAQKEANSHITGRSDHTVVRANRKCNRSYGVESQRRFSAVTVQSIMRLMNVQIKELRVDTNNMRMSAIALLRMLGSAIVEVTNLT